MLSDLQTPDASGLWLLPKLEVIVLDSVRTSILKVLTAIVTNRMKSRTPVAQIRSVTVPGLAEQFENTLQKLYLSSLNLLVSEVKIIRPRYVNSMCSGIDLRPPDTSIWL